MPKTEDLEHLKKGVHGSSSRNRYFGFSKVFRKPDHNDPHGAHVSLGGMIITALIFAVGVIGLLYLFEEIGFENPNPRYYEAPKPWTPSADPN